MMIASVRLPLICLRCAYDINPQFSSTHRGCPRSDGAFRAHPALEWDHRCINISSATSAPPYIRLKGRATDFVPLPEGEKLGLDRKSTRLNSRHTVISYDVFCLKKKK